MSMPKLATVDVNWPMPQMSLGMSTTTQDWPDAAENTGHQCIRLQPSHHQITDTSLYTTM